MSENHSPFDEFPTIYKDQISLRKILDGDRSGLVDCEIR